MMIKEEKKIIARVRGNKKTNHRAVTIPKEIKNIEVGDYVEIKKVKIVENGN